VNGYQSNRGRGVSGQEGKERDNTHFENERITRETVDRAAEKLSKGNGKKDLTSAGIPGRDHTSCSVMRRRRPNSKRATDFSNSMR